MTRPQHHDELGRLVDVHRPMNPLLAVALVAVGPILIAILPAIGLGPVVGLVFLLGFGIVLLYGFGELLFLQHRIYEHGFVTRSLPGLRTYVVPHYTINPDDIAVADRRVHRDRIVVDRALRGAPSVEKAVWFSGLAPKCAHELAKGKLAWGTAGDKFEVHDGQSVPVPRPDSRWSVSYRDAEHHRQVLAEAVRASQRTRPYYRSGRDRPASG